MTGSNSRWITLIPLALAAGLGACGGSSTTSASSGAATTATATAAVATPTASAQCPSGSTVGSALGTTLPSPVGVAGGGGTSLPAGAIGIVCQYHAAADNVIIILITNISPSYIAQFSAHFPVAFQTVAGVGDQARAFSQSLNGGKDNEGLVATKGSTLVSITATATPASLSQVESLVNSLL